MKRHQRIYRHRISAKGSIQRPVETFHAHLQADIGAALKKSEMEHRLILETVLKKVGGMRALGRQLGINYQNFQSWKKIPVTRVADIERITGIPREKLRPDIFR